MTNQPLGKAVAKKQRELRVWERERERKGGRPSLKQKGRLRGFGCATICFTAALTQNRTALTQG